MRFQPIPFLALTDATYQPVPVPDCALPVHSYTLPPQRAVDTYSPQSIAGARLHFMKMMCGYDEESIEEANSYYTTNTSSRSARQTRDTDKRRGGDRASGR